MPNTPPEVKPRETELTKVNWRFLIAVPVAGILILFVLYLFWPTNILAPMMEQTEQEEENQTPYWANLREYRSSLSTISATSTTDNPNWMLYRNEEYGFEIEIPTDWDIIKEFETVKEVENSQDIQAGSFRIGFNSRPEDSALTIISTSDNLNDGVLEQYSSYTYSTSSRIINTGKNYFFIIFNESISDQEEQNNHMSESFKTFDPQPLQ